MDNVFLEINACANHSECSDCARMLYEMYLKWAEKHGFECSTVEPSPNQDFGTGKFVIDIIGDGIYDFLQNEIGLHRIVRISPLDPQKRRHTSFVAVGVYQKGMTRSYILSPYQQVKNHYNDIVSNDAQSVLDGELDQFMKGNK